MNKSAQPVPIVILGGSDLKPARLPEEGQEPITGYKGVDLQIGGRPLVAELIERLEESGAFDPVFIAGPAEIYGPVRGKARLIDTDGRFGDNIRCSIETVRADLGPGPMAFITCDVLPEAETLRELMANQDSHICDIWFPLGFVELSFENENYNFCQVNDDDNDGLFDEDGYPVSEQDFIS